MARTAENNPGTDLAAELEKAGLDGVYWSQVFNDVLSVRNTRALQYLGDKDYEKLKEHSRHEWERAALREMLGLKKKQLEKQEPLMKRVEQVKRDLAELQKLHREGIDRNSALVKEREEKIRSALDIPQECWVPAGQPLKNLVENLHKQLGLLEGSSLSSPGNVADEEVLRSASGGLALEGVYCTRNLEDMVEKREQLIEVPEGFTLSGPQHSSLYEQEEFSSYQTQTLFQKVVEKLGYTFRCSVKAGFKAFSIENTAEKSHSTEKEKSSKSSSEHSYIWKTMFNYVPLASSFLEKDKLKLSSAAMRDLRDIETVLLNTDEDDVTPLLIERVVRFFQRFGSHANQGPLHFGGVFWWKASAEGFSSSDLTKMNSLTSEALNIYVGAGYSGLMSSISIGVSTSATELKGSFTGNYTETQMSKVKLSVTKTGGPAQTDNHLQWKCALVSSNRTWHVIDRGTRLIPVWDIILSAHTQDFKDPFKLSSWLVEAYRRITGQDADLMSGENVLSAEREAQALIQKVNWAVSNSKQILTDLLQFKIKLREKTGSHKIWFQTCLSNEDMQEFLLEAVKKHNPEEAINLRMVVRSLMEPHLYTVKNFPNRAEIIKWVYHNKEEIHRDISVSEFSELAEILKQTKEELQDSKFALSDSVNMREAKIKATCTITFSLTSLRQTLVQNNEEETELLVLSIVTSLGYSLKNKTFSYLLDWKDVDVLENELQKAYDKYCSLKEQAPARAQAYLVLTALTVSRDEQSVSSQDKEKRLQFLKSQLKDQMYPDVFSAVAYVNEQQDWERLQQELMFIIEKKGTNVGTEEIVKDLKNLTCSQEVSFSESSHSCYDVSQSSVQQDCHPDTVKEHSGKAVNNKTDAFMNLLQKLGLRDSYPCRMKKTDVLVINSLSCCASQPQTEKDLCFHYLYKLMMLDYSYRSMFLKVRVAEYVKRSTPSQNAIDAIICSDDFFNPGVQNFTTCDDQDSDKVTHIHPMDVHMAVFHCSGNFLRPYLFSKLSTCQFALPLLVPSPCTGAVEFPLWALRQIKRSWCSKESSERGSTVKHNSKDMFETEVPTVSFIRLGSSSVSKSQILNNIISPKKHNVFFHRHCRGGSPDCLLMDGVVEIAWYCPGGRKDDVFENCVAFLNLHGDASKHPEQLQFLQEVSTIIVVLISETSLDEDMKKIAQTLLNSSVPLICLLAGMENVPHSNNPTRVRLAAKSRNESDLTDEIISHVKHILSTHSTTASLQTVLQAARRQFRVDEDYKSCREGKEKAQILLGLLNENELLCIKENLLPLQGELWHKWCMKDKEQHRLHSKANKSIEQQVSEIRAEKIALRREQLKKAFPLNDFMRSFLECLTSGDSQDNKLFMLQWLRMYLDELTTDTLTELQEKYHSTWTTLRQKEKTKDKEQETKLQKDLSSISEQISAATLGLQHLMREIAQLYEAVQLEGQGLEDYRWHANVLPAIGVEILISGYPLELMDGDAAHVPLVWIEAVLDKLTERLENGKVFVLSVIGVQSSGKSTMLNTMFGLQFTVSAGRCTRGAFMQLLRVSEDVRAQLQYDFVLVVDTEGLRSPELSNKATLSHDNELATFIIGIGDITLINIMGENPSEMQDILQICVQAFLRMKSVQIKPNCIFVHQNVAEASANSMNMEGRRRLQESLDEMARIAAREEGFEITGFGDIIQFDVESQVYYFKNLLEGDPPMAPPNPSYSQNVQDLKMKLLTVAQWKPGVTFPLLSDFKLRIRDLWNALLGENFVFSFRNTLEMMVYSKLEDKYGEWSWKMRKRALEVQNRLRNQITNKIIQGVTSADLMREFDEVYRTLTDEIEKYFKEEKYQEILIKWKVNVDKRFESLRNELIEENQKQCSELIRLKKCRTELDRKKSEYEAELITMSKDLASRLKEQKLSDKKIEEQFDRLWVNWVTRVSSEQPPEQQLNVKARVENILLDKFKNQGDVINTIVKREKIFQFNKKKHMKQTWYQKAWHTVTSHDPQWEIHGKELTQQIKTNVNKYMEKKENEKVDFNDNFIHEILGLIKGDINEYEKFLEQNIFTNEYEFELSVHLCTTVVGRFEKMHTAFKRANDPLIYLESKRDEYLDCFKSFCKGATSVTFFVDFLCKRLKPAIQQAVCDKTCIQITDKMKSNYPAFNGNRSNLENHILKHLAEQEDFDSYMEYINHPKHYFERFIRERVERYCKDNKDQLKKMFLTNLDDLVQQILRESTMVTAAVKEKQSGASAWLDEFCAAVGDHVSLPREEFTNIENEVVKDLQFLGEMMACSLGEILENLKKENSRIDLTMFRQRPDEILCEALSGCWEQCPFCKAICTNTILSHSTDHSVQFHRPSALAGWSFYKTDNFSLYFCTTAVTADISFKSCKGWIPFKQYRTAGAPYDKWSITSDGSEQSYWKWFICTFRSQLEKKFGYKFAGLGEIPADWERKKDAALKDVQ
ncbi:interferon-induced very large GTPase 1-like [Lepisosteus oculatus]|uniref:interferon-induced very large GTPase 1-like n=1 Tax=Lepisosteus oculatus TaxID=7918 RepID=UPI00370F7854